MLISFEGLPGAGKSTQAALLAGCLTRHGRAPTPEHRSYLQWVNEAYTELAHRDPQLTVLDVGTLQPTEVHHTVHLTLSELGYNLAGADTTSGRCAGLPHVAGGPS